MMTPNTNDCDSPNDRYGSPEAVVHPEGEESRVRSSTTLTVEVVRERTVLSVCQALYVDSGNDKTVLCVLAIGLKTNDDTPLFAVNEEPWCSLTKQQFRSPQNTDLVKEIRRRAKLVSRNSVSATLPKPANWTKSKSFEWLESNPVSEAADVEFLTTEVLRVREVYKAMIEEKERRRVGESSAVGTDASNARVGGGAWRGNVPYMRIIMCLTEDDVKALFLARANGLSRSELDARNCDSR
jgi:hypothetical protein